MNLKLKHFFIIFSILLFAIQVQADAPISYNKELASDVELRGTFFTDDNSDGFYVSFNDGTIQIVSGNHYTDKVIKIKGTALTSRLKKYNGFNVGYTHIADDGTTTNEIKSLSIDKQGFAYLTCDFSTVIINGMTGTTTTTLNGLSGNQSISVPNGSSYDLNITNNQEGVWTINGTDYSKRVLWTLNTTTENLTDIQVKRVTPYDSDMQADMDDRQLTYYENDTLIPFWDENVTNSVNATGYVKVPKTSTTEQQQYWLYYDNPSVSSASSGDDTFPSFFDGDSMGWTEVDPNSHIAFANNRVEVTNLARNEDAYVYQSIVDGNYTLDVDIYQSGGDNYGRMAISFGDIIDDHNHINNGFGFYTYPYSGTFGLTPYRIISDAETHGTAITGLSQSTWYYVRSVNDGTTLNIYVYSDSARTVLVDSTSVDISGAPSTMSYIYLAQSSNTGHSTKYSGYNDNLKVRKYTATEPTWVADGEEQTTSGTKNITASVTGDNNTQSYNTSQSREFTLTPTGTTNNVFVNTTSTDYDVTVTTYWTENTTLQTETATAGYAKQYINYTPSFNVTSADLNTTFTFNFSAQDYIGAATSTLDDVSKTTTRDGQDINASVGSLTESVPYWWNVTVPYNNIPTVGTIANQTAYLGIQKSFTAPSYNDPEGLAIDTHYWQFGDGNTSSDQNPTNTYTSIDTFSANYTVTETATVSPQAVLREFTVDVEVQPPQNVTTVPHQTNVSIDWDDYAYADKYSVYELEDGFPYVDTNPTVDGVKDAIYDCAHEFLIFSPNPVNPGDYETSYPIRTSLGAYFFHEAVDNDDKLGDDDLIYHFDLDNDGLTVDDPAWKITNNIVKKYEWNGASWQVTGVSDAVGASTGGSTHYPKHELFIPIAELGANWTNGSTVKVLVKREDSSLTPDVIVWYPYGNINDTDTLLWQEMVLNYPESYIWLANVTLSNYTALNLTPFTIYHGAVTAWNGSHESSYTLFDVITEDIPVYNVSGYVFDDLGNTLAGATVYSCNAFVHEITQTDIYGYWIGYNFREGNYTICANKSGYAQNFTNIYVSTNLTNVNVTLPAFEMTDWMLWEKLLEIEDLLDVEESAPTEITKMTYQIFILLMIIDLLAVWYSFTNTDKSYYTDIITSLLAVIISGIISYNSITGVSYYFATQYTVHEIEYTSVSLMVLFASVSIVMLIFFVTKILELTHEELGNL